MSLAPSSPRQGGTHVLPRAATVLPIAAVAAAAAVGCGTVKHASVSTTVAQTTTSTTTALSTPPSSANPGFLAHASNGVLFIQWTRTGNSVTGTLSESYTDQANAAQVTNASHSFTGVISGSSITLTLDSGDNWNGTLTNSGVSLSYAGSDGTLHTFAFNNATVDDYNTAVAGTATKSRSAAHAQAQQHATQQAQQTLNGEATAIVSDISSLRTDLSQLNTDLSQVPTDLAQMRSDLTTQKSDLNKLLVARASGCQNGADYQVSSTDNYQVTSTDDYQITSTDAYSLDNDQQAISDAVLALLSDKQKEIRGQSALPTYTPAALPSTGEIQKTTNTAIATAKAAKMKWNLDLALVKQLDAASNDYAAEANRACGN